MGKFTKRRLTYRCPGSREEESAFLKAHLISYWKECFAFNWGRAMRGPQGKVESDKFSIKYNPQGNGAWWSGRSAVTFVGDLQETEQSLSVQVEEVWDPTVKRIHLATTAFSAVTCLIILPTIGVILTAVLALPLLYYSDDPKVPSLVFTFVAELAVCYFLFALMLWGPILQLALTFGMPDYEDPILRFKALVGTRWELVSEEVLA